MLLKSLTLFTEFSEHKDKDIISLHSSFPQVKQMKKNVYFKDS